MLSPLKIFSSKQIREADRFTIQNEPSASIDLMERAAAKCVEWIKQKFNKENSFSVFCGHGNNGGDGLAIARMLLVSGFEVKVFIAGEGKYSEECIINKKRLEEKNSSVIHILLSADDFDLQKNDIIIDALFGTGLSRPVTGFMAGCINTINQNGNKIISIDIPSGLFADISSDHSSAIVKAQHTLTFQFPKYAFFFAQNAEYVGDWEIIDIGLSKKFIDAEPSGKYLITKDLIKNIFRPRRKFSHKGTFGHALLIAGSYGKIGAAVLSARACLRSGAGLLTVHLPQCGYEIMQVSNPETMVTVDANEKMIGDMIGTENFSSVGIGPGIGTEQITQKMLYGLLTKSSQSLVIDADALNILGQEKKWLDQIPANSILTPHPKEFERIAGRSNDDFERHELQVAFSKKFKVYVILKGAHTCITTPSGESYFNNTGNPGMAKGGSGDVLTGIITGILAQKYSPLETGLLSVYIHGLAGDLAKNVLGETAMRAGDICDFLPAAFQQINKK